MRLNTDFVHPHVDVHWEDKEGEHIVHDLRSSIDNFVLSGSPERALTEISKNPNNHLLILGINNISFRNVRTNLDKYKLTVKGLIVPEENFKYLQDLEMEGLSEVYIRNFKSTPFLKGQSFSVKSPQSRDRPKDRTDYVISPQHTEFYEILDSLGAPDHLILR